MARPSRRDVLLGTAAAGLVLGAGGLPGLARNLVVVVADGGWDPTFTFDPKPGVSGITGPYADRDPDVRQDVETLGTWGDIDVTLNAHRRPQVTRYFERWGSRTAVVRGVWVGSVSHWIGRRRILSGTDDPDAPDIVTRYGALRGSTLPLGAVDLSNVGRFGELGRMTARGGVRGQLGQLLQPSTRYPRADGTARRTLEQRPAEREARDRWLADQGRLETTSRPFDAGREEALAHRSEARTRAHALRDRRDLLEIPPPGPQNAKRMARFAASLLATGTCASVIIDSGSRWDTHVDHTLQHAAFDGVFGGLDTLLSALDAAGVLDHTLVVAMSEMTRSPWRNPEGGTEHWPYGALVLAGAGVAGGQVCGGTDDRLVGRPVDVESGATRSGGALLRYDHVIAGVLAHLGVDLASTPLAGVVPLRGFATR